MQQWKQTCAVEVSIVQGVQGLSDLLRGLLNIGLDSGGLAHWGQQIDWAFKQHGSVYPHYKEWRQFYLKMSNNFRSRTFENALSLRWNLTTPNDAQFVSQTVVETMEPGQSQSVAVTMQNTGVSTWTRSASYRLGSQAPQDNIIWGTNRVRASDRCFAWQASYLYIQYCSADEGYRIGKTVFFEWERTRVCRVVWSCYTVSPHPNCS